MTAPGPRRALAASVASAALLCAAAPSLDLWPLALIALVPLYLSVRAMPPGKAFFYGWLTGLLVNLYGFAWGIGLLARFGHLARPWAGVVVAVACAYQALVLGLFTGGAALLHARARVPWLVGGPLILVVSEALVPMVFPWGLGICLWRAWPLIQVAELGGLTAVSALLVLANLTFAEVFCARRRRAPLDRAVRRAVVVLVGIVGLGLARAGHIAWLRDRAPRLRVGIVQPNLGVVSAAERAQHGQAMIDALRAATDALGQRGAQLVIWPESAFPFLFDRQLARELAPGHPWALRGSYRGHLLLGALTHEFGGADIYNSALLIAPDGRIAGRHDKVHLMPFGEYVPFADRAPAWARRIRSRMPDASDITPGSAITVLADGPLRIAPAICYEEILPEVHDRMARAAPAPNLLVTLASYAWFGDSLAPRMALALATIASVELRRDLVRATSTGVTSIGDALGRVRAERPLVAPPAPGAGEADLVVGDVALVEPLTLGRWGARGFPYACALALAVTGWRRRRRPTA